MYSPHNLIVEQGSKFNLKDVAQELAIEFDLKSKKEYYSDPIDKYTIVEKKTIFLSSTNKKVLSGKKK